MPLLIDLGLSSSAPDIKKTFYGITSLLSLAWQNLAFRVCAYLVRSVIFFCTQARQTECFCEVFWQQASPNVAKPLPAIVEPPKGKNPLRADVRKYEEEQVPKPQLGAGRGRPCARAWPPSGDGS